MTSTLDRPIIPLPLALKRLLIDICEPSDLRELAALKETNDPKRVARHGLDADGLTELADLLEAGRIPTVGWWRRHRTEELAA